MDPLSVSASVAGLLTATQQVSSLIGKIIQSKKTGCKEIEDVRRTVDNLRRLLLQLQLLLLGHASSQVDAGRASLILVDEIVVTLTACVMTFSDLDGCVKGLETDSNLGILDSIRWASREPELKRYLQDLEAHKSSLTLMVNILTCQSVHSAERSASELRVLLVHVLENNEALLDRMSRVERTVGVPTIQQPHEDSESTISQETYRFQPNVAGAPLSEESNHYSLAGFAFEEDLHNSWVYQRSVSRGPRAFSIDTSTKFTQSWSILSGLSLSKVSNIAIHCLPIYESDISNGDIYYFGGPKEGINPETQLPLFRDLFANASAEAENSNFPFDPMVIDEPHPPSNDPSHPEGGNLTSNEPLEAKYNIIGYRITDADFEPEPSQSYLGYPFLRTHNGEVFTILNERMSLLLVARSGDDRFENVGWITRNGTTPLRALRRGAFTGDMFS